jgi:malonyl-CoA O-methyltransferase
MDGQQREWRRGLQCEVQAADGLRPVTALNALDGYRLWAPNYAGETAISLLEDDLVAEMTPPLADNRLLDAGCGTGRRLLASGAASATGLDLCAEMLDAGIGRGDGRFAAQVGDVRAMPFVDCAFDVVWCRLVLGHLPDCTTAYAELARVVDVGGKVIVTDFHPAAYAAGHRRTFRHDGVVREVEHFVHDAATHVAAAEAVGLRLEDVQSAKIGSKVRGFYERAGRMALYQAHLGLPVVLALSFRRG